LTIETVATVTPELVAALARLLPQLSPGVREPTHDDLTRVVGEPGSVLLVARDEGGAIVGTLTLLVYATPSKVFGFVEDVVVDAAARGRGIGEALVTEALRLAAERGAVRTELHSSSRREAAIRLYERLGFKRVDTNTLRYSHESRPGARAAPGAGGPR
jgi:ribosomal protein S18 acetylase RimI-like enzyme